MRVLPVLNATNKMYNAADIANKFSGHLSNSWSKVANQQRIATAIALRLHYVRITVWTPVNGLFYLRRLCAYILCYFCVHEINSTNEKCPRKGLTHTRTYGAVLCSIGNNQSTVTLLVP